MDLQPIDFATLTATLSAVCTNEPKTVHAKLLESLATALSESLSADDCHRLAELLTSQREENA